MSTTISSRPGPGRRSPPNEGQLTDTATSSGRGPTERPPRAGRLHLARGYPRWFYIPAAVVFGLMFIVPTLLSFFYAFTRWTLFEHEWNGVDNIPPFIRDPSLTKSLRNTVIYAVVTSGLKVVIGMALAVLVTSPRLHIKATIRSIIFFPVLVSTVAVGITFERLMHPSSGLLNQGLGVVGINGPKWLTDPNIALLSVAFVDVWQGVGLALVIFIAGILSIPQELYESVAVDGGGSWDRFRYVILPLSRPATFTVILLSFVGGLRRFDLIWTMTGGGPGFTTDVIASTVYKQYQAGFYGLSTAGNVVLFILVMILVFPLNWFLRRKELAR